MYIGFSEDLTHEFKSDLNKLPDSDIIDAVVAFANTDGGELYLGVEDNGEITGLHKSHMDTTQLAAFIANKTVPPIAVRTEILELDRPVLKIDVPKKTAIVSSSAGKIQRRRLKPDGTPENVPLYPYEIATRLSSLSLFDYSAQPVPDSDYGDLDTLERERLRNIIRSYRGEVALLELEDEELDKALQLVTTLDGKLVPTFCGLLLIGRKDKLKQYMPTAESAIQVLSGTDVRVNESFYLPILAAFEKIMECFSAWNREEELEMGLFRYAIPDFDQRAFREALVNAFSHRDYAALGRVRVQITDEGMMVTNPGGFVEGIRADNLINAEPHGRNPALADALKRIGLAERTGRGIDRIYEGSLLYGRALPDYSHSTTGSVRLFIPKGPTDKAFIQMLSHEHQRTGRSLSIYSLLVVSSLRQFHRASVQDVVADIHTDERRTRVILESLTDSGLVEAGGTGRGRYYMLGSAYYRYKKDMVSYTRQKGIDTIRYDELILHLAKQQGFVKRADVIDLLHIDAPQAYRILANLVKHGHLVLTGRGAGAKYVINKKQ